MENNEQPDDSGAPWNSDDLVFGGITCKQLSRLCTCFVSALRMANGEGKELGIKGKMILVRTLIDQQLALADSPELTDEERKIIEATGPVGPDDEVIIQIRKGEETYGEEHIEMGIRLEPTSDLLQKFESDNVGKQIKNIIAPPYDAPEAGPLEQGPN